MCEDFMREKRTKFALEGILGDPLMERLHDPSPGVRQAAWSKIHDDVIDGRLPTTKDLLVGLPELLKEEKDVTVMLTALQIMPAAYLVMSGEDPAPDRLGPWLWHPFRRPSLLLCVEDPNRYSRDEQAMMILCRRLGQQEFPATKPDSVELGRFTHGVVDLDDKHAIAFLGRLTLFGREAADSWGMKKPRFRFGLEERPKGLKHGELHPDYHVVVEGMGPYDEPIRYVTTQTGNTRTDYGLVRRYVVRHGRDFFVVHCAGSSRYGTWAAAHWAAQDLFVTSRDGKLLPVPEGIQRKDRLEALIQVTADRTAPTLTQQLKEIKLLDLRVADKAWNPDEYKWERPTPRRITLLHSCRSGEKVPNDAVTSILLDGKPAGLKKEGENVRLLVASCGQAFENGGRVDDRQLAHDPWIWSHGSHEAVRKSVRYVRTRLAGLKANHLGRALLIEDDHYRLTASIRYHAIRGCSVSS